MKKYWQDFIIVILAGVLVNLSFHVARAGLVSGFSDAVSSVAISTAANHDISLTISSALEPDQTLELYFETGFDLSLIDYTDIDFLDDSLNKTLAGTPGTGADSAIGVSVSGQTIIFTQNDTDTIASGSVINILIGANSQNQTTGDQQIYNPDSPGIYYISVSGSFGDMGTIAVQILTTDSVGFTGKILPSISVSLRNYDDTAGFSGCDLGLVSTSIVAECSYRLVTETNLPNGFQLFIQSDGALRNQNYSISGVTEDSIVTAGAESYGLALAGAIGLTEAGNYSDDDTPILSTGTLLLSSNLVYNYIQGDLSTSSLITQKLAVSKITPAGNYSQQIYYSMIGNF